MQTANGLALHMNLHTGKYPFTCAVCNKGYNSNMTLKAHMDSHLNVKVRNLPIDGTLFIITGN